MEIKDSYELPLPKERVWAALNDEEFLKKSIPWCEKLERRSETELAAEVKLKIGPMSTRFTGSITLSDIDPPNGYTITGSDDLINDPSKSRLKKYNLLPEDEGWFSEKISSDIDAIVLGMHAKADNPELIKAKELGLQIYSYPEFIYNQSKDKIRIVIGGSHGKTSITSLILHVLKEQNIDADYMVGAQLKGFEVMVKLSDSSKYIVLEGDDYLSSDLYLRPKFCCIFLL